jgi:hypothetical protein
MAVRFNAAHASCQALAAGFNGIRGGFAHRKVDFNAQLRDYPERTL